MIALYTETFEEFLKRQGQSAEWKALETKFAKFPTFTLGELSFDMYQLFIDKYEIYEIGAEDENLFFHIINDKVNELSIKYIPKIQMYIQNFGIALERKLNLNSNGDTTNYLYPISTVDGQVATRVHYDGNKDSALLIFKSNAELLEQAMNLKDIYLDCLKEFENCFMLMY